MSGKSNTRLSRRAILAAGAGVALGTVSGQNSNDEQGDLLGGTMSLDEAYNVAGDLWIGPAAARNDVKATAGRVYIASDEQVDYRADGSGDWVAKGVGSEQKSVPSIHTESISNVYEFVDGSMTASEINQVISDASTSATDDERLAIVFKAGSYELTDYINGQSNVALIGRGAHLIAFERWQDPTGAPGAIDFADGEQNFLVEGFSIDGVDGEFNADYGIRAKGGCSDFTIRDNVVRHTADDGITCENNCTDWYVSGNRCYDIGDDSIGTDNAGFEVEQGAHNGTLVGNVTKRTDYGVMVKSRSGDEVNGISFVGNHTEDCGIAGIEVKGDDTPSLSKNISITGHTSHNDETGLSLARWIDGLTVSNNEIVNSNSTGITLANDNVTDMTVTSNRIQGANTGISVGIDVFDCTISDNTITDCSARGIVVGSSGVVEDITISGGVVANCGFDGGINLEACVDCTVEGVTIRGNGNHGINTTSGTVNPTLSDNTIHGNDGRGIHLLDSTDATVHDNAIHDNDTANSEGILINGGSNGSVQSNNITNQNQGIRLTGGAGSFVVVLNDIRGNTEGIVFTDETGTVTDPVNQDTTEDYNIS